MNKDKDWLGQCLATNNRSAPSGVLKKSLALYDAAQERRSRLRPWERMLQFSIKIAVYSIAILYDFIGEVFSLFGFNARSRRSHERMTGAVTAAMLVLSFTYVSLENR
jgi:hypothetical protein